MARKDGRFDDTTEVVEIAVEAHAPRTTKVMVRAPHLKRYSFEQWAKLREKPVHHLRGMKASLGDAGDHRHEMSAWDAIFKAY